MKMQNAESFAFGTHCSQTGQFYSGKHTARPAPVRTGGCATVGDKCMWTRDSCFPVVKEIIPLKYTGRRLSSAWIISPPHPRRDFHKSGMVFNYTVNVIMFPRDSTPQKSPPQKKNNQAL